MKTWRKEWAQKKSDIALKLAAGECGGSYGEAVIILCAVLSALSAEVWPGLGIDRVRFVELLKEFAPPDLNVTRISIPLLVAYLRTSDRRAKSEVIKKTFLNYYPSRVLVGDEVDKSETEILSECSTLTAKALRKHSYANLLYGEIRSGYAHQYRPGERADSWSMTTGDAAISYINWIENPDRHIHLHVSWISKLTLTTAEAVDAAAASLPRTPLPPWWVAG